MRVRLRKLKRDIVDVVARNDVFALREPTMFANALLPGRGAFKFMRSGDKVEAFMNWLQEAEANSILEVTKGTPQTVVGSGAWTDVYIETAYKKGLASAGNNMKQQGFDVGENFMEAAFMRPVHADRAGLIYTRSFNELKGISDAMDQQISRVLAQSIAEGLGPKATARKLVNRVDKIAKPRAETLARTEIIAAHADASLNAYKDMGINEVEAEVEFATAGDNDVCPLCEALEDQKYTIEEASGVIPVHPNCRCTWLPVVAI